MIKTTVIGTTSWGITLGHLMASKGYHVHVWARTESEAYEHNHKTEHHANLSFTSSPFEAIEESGSGEKDGIRRRGWGQELITECQGRIAGGKPAQEAVGRVEDAAAAEVGHRPTRRHSFGHRDHADVGLGGNVDSDRERAPRNVNVRERACGAAIRFGGEGGEKWTPKFGPVTQLEISDSAGHEKIAER